MLFKKLMYRQALNSLALGEYEKAEALFKKFYKTGKTVQGIRHNIGVCLMAREQFAEAEPWFKQEMDDFGECFSRTLALGDLYYNWGRREEALDYYTRTLKDCSNETMKRFLSVRIGICKKEEAFADAQESLKLLKEGRSLSEQGDYDRALELLDRSFALDKSQYQGLNEAGVILLNKKNDPAGALERFEKALRLSDLSIIRKNRELAQRMTEKG